MHRSALKPPKPFNPPFNFNSRLDPQVYSLHKITSTCSLHPCITSAYLIAVCVCDLVGTFVQGGRRSNVIHIEMGPAAVNIELQENTKYQKQKPKKTLLLII